MGEGKTNRLAVGDVELDVETVPGHSGDISGLGDDGGGDLVTEGAHGVGRRAEEGDVGGDESVDELGVLTGVAPTSPDTLGLDALSNVDDELKR